MIYRTPVSMFMSDLKDTIIILYEEPASIPFALLSDMDA